jgi:hypothetical protein
MYLSKPFETILTARHEKDVMYDAAFANSLGTAATDVVLISDFTRKNILTISTNCIISMVFIKLLLMQLYYAMK